MWLEAKNIQLNQLSKKLDHKIYESFRISKDIGQEVFQLELLEGWAIHNVLNKDLLTQYREPHFKKQYMDLALPPDIIKEEYKVEEVWNHRK